MFIEDEPDDWPRKSISTRMSSSTLLTNSTTVPMPHRVPLTRRQFALTSVALGTAYAMSTIAELPGDESPNPLELSWEKNFLTIRGNFPGGEIKIMYLEAYCRPGSTDREWGDTVIPHKARQLPAKTHDGSIRLEDTLADGVIVNHVIKANSDDIEFNVAVHNPTVKESQAHWAQPCIRVDKFTGAGSADARALVPDYARKCFLFLNGRLTRLPTEPWADKARYTPGQVYCPKDVDCNDVNPRPLSQLVPTRGLCGCFSGDEESVMAVAWEPYQEIFQGVIACIHSDFRIGGLNPNETKKIRGKLYITDTGIAALLRRYRRDFPEHVARPEDESRH
jgi:hypothetical protein